VLSNCYCCNTKYLQVEVKLRPTVCLGVRRPSGTRDQFSFLLEIFFRQLRVYYFVAPSLKRGRVCNLLYNCFWSLPEQSLLGRSPSELRQYFTVTFETPPNLEGQVPVFISPRNTVAQLCPRILGSLLSPLTTRRATVLILEQSSHCNIIYVHINNNL
jgi:hypothetical protein